jgi:hypothetical protein
MLVNIEEEDRDDSRLPVMTVNDIRMLVRLQHEFKCCPAEKGEPFRIIVVAVINAAVEKVPVRMGFNEEAFPAVDKPEEDGTVNLVIIEGDPEIAIHLLETVDVIIAHAVVFGEDDLHRVPPYLKLVGEAVYYICQAAHFCNGCTLRCDGNNKHETLLRNPLYGSSSSRKVDKAQSPFSLESDAQK